MLYFKLKKAIIYATLNQKVAVSAIIVKELNMTFRELHVNTELKNITQNLYKLSDISSCKNCIKKAQFILNSLLHHQKKEEDA